MSAEEIAELRAQAGEEPHRGYTPLVRELRNVADQIIATRAQIARLSPREVSFMPRPLMAGDLISDRESELARAELDNIIDAAHAAYQQLEAADNYRWEVRNADL